tara:strand:- start:352 stop:909 length:558 start_codon:yes stop_codon:yes gene_type:complete
MNYYFNLFSKIKSYFVLIVLSFFLLSSCNYLKKTDSDTTGMNAAEKRRKNIEEGRGAGLGNILGRGDTNFEFSSSNPLWRASLATLDFMPMNTVDYSGGMIITDWYNDGSNDDSLKITVRFLSNEIRSDSLKIILHSKKCSPNNNCKVSLLNNSKIHEELHSVILKKAAILQKESKDSKKKSKKR